MDVFLAEHAIARKSAAGGLWRQPHPRHNHNQQEDDSDAPRDTAIKPLTRHTKENPFPFFSEPEADGFGRIIWP